MGGGIGGGSGEGGSRGSRGGGGFLESGALEVVLPGCTRMRGMGVLGERGSSGRALCGLAGGLRLQNRCRHFSFNWCSLCEFGELIPGEVSMLMIVLDVPVLAFVAEVATAIIRVCVESVESVESMVAAVLSLLVSAALVA